MSKPRETELYAPVKSFLEAQGYEVKGEIGAVDVMACRAAEDPVIVELKTGFALSLFHQAVARQLVTDWVYVAVPRGTGRAFQASLKNNTKLCRRLGIGLLTVRLDDGLVQVHCDPGPFTPRKSKQRKGALLKEFAKRRGDPSEGGATRDGLVTAYRQDAIKLRDFLAEHGPSKGAIVAKTTGVAAATRMMRENHYGWFEKVGPGTYALSETATEGN